MELKTMSHNSICFKKKNKKPQKRTYQPIWERIKEKGRATITVPHKRLISTVVKAVCKEKYMDLGFKTVNDHDKFYLDILRDEENLRITFILRQSLGLEDRKVV
jgi:hypothetical protein